jgi:hypothetical protein
MLSVLSEGHSITTIECTLVRITCQVVLVVC